MRKFNLDPDGLRVESFETHASASENGTVRGHAATSVEDCQQTTSTNGGEACICVDSGNATCVECRTDEATCGNSCWGTCTCP